MGLLAQIPESWRPVLEPALRDPAAQSLSAFLDAERAGHTVFPPADEVFNALALTPFERVSVVILGQDPYHDDGQAHGLAFSVRAGVKQPPSLVNIFKELESDLGVPRPRSGNLEGWARQGVLLLNASLTVRAHAPSSHKGRGWERITDAIISAVNAKPDRVVFVLWGAHAQKKLSLIDPARHTVIQSAHPSPLSAKSGFFGSKPFSKSNAALIHAGKPAIDWRLDG
jgi:uracil-DNA glycosylase